MLWVAVDGEYGARLLLRLHLGDWELAALLVNLAWPPAAPSGAGPSGCIQALPPMETLFRTEPLESCTALTLTLSPGERESAWPRSLGSTQSECPDALFPQYAPKWSPSPGGEGWGEGGAGPFETMFPLGAVPECTLKTTTFALVFAQRRRHDGHDSGLLKYSRCHHEFLTSVSQWFVASLRRSRSPRVRAWLV